MRFQKGQSGNPAGRPRVVAEFRNRCRKVVDELCIAAWEAEVEGKGEDWLRASELLAAYGYGRPSKVEADETDESGGLPQGLTVEELRELARAAREAKKQADAAEAH